MDATDRPPQTPADAGPALPFDRILTELMTVETVGAWFDVHRHTAAKLIEGMRGVVRVGGLVRLPVMEMPPSYWIESGLIRPVLVSKFGETWTAAETEAASVLNGSRPQGQSRPHERTSAH